MDFSPLPRIPLIHHPKKIITVHVDTSASISPKDFGEFRMWIIAGNLRWAECAWKAAIEQLEEES